MKYLFTTSFYSGFKASEEEIKSFPTMGECFKAWKKSRKHDFSYDDGTYHHTGDIVADYSHPTPKHVYHKHVRVEKPYTIVDSFPDVKDVAPMTTRTTSEDLFPYLEVGLEF